jgi:hypothetical protein
MANEITVPLLPCPDIDEIEAFYTMLGFTRTSYQARPYPHVSVRREDINLHFFVLPDFNPEDSYGSCLVIVPDTGELYRAFAEGMRAAHGKILVTGIPRMTRPRRRKNADNMSGFAVIDPGGNWIRIHAAPADSASEPARSRLGKSLDSAVVMGDSRGTADQAVRILDGALARDDATATPVDLVNALAYRAELAVRTDDPDGAHEFLTRAAAVALTDAERVALADTLTDLRDLAATLPAAEPREA